MERKSIGSFISALRKANGMTQKKLAEMLNVSDKAVSRWERDECAPDLSLIPVIAEIFDVTADELLCGERKSSASANVKTNNTRTEKQKQRLLNSAFEKFRNKSLISLGVSAFAIILGIVVELIFKTYPVTLIFVVIAVVASLICEITFIHNLWLAVDAEEFDDIKTDSLKVKAIDFSKRIFAVNYWVLFTAGLLPFFLSFCTGNECEVYNQFEEYSDRVLSIDIVLIALVYVAIGFVIFKTIWCFILKKIEKSGAYPVDETDSKLLNFKRIYSTIFSFVLLFTIMLQTSFFYPLDFYSMKPTILNDEKSFLEYMSDSGSEIGYAEVCGLSIYFSALDVELENDYVERFFDENNNVIYEYTCKRNDVAILDHDTENVFPVEVLTLEQVAHAEVNYRLICFGILILEMFIFATVYKVIFNRKKKK